MDLSTVITVAPNTSPKIHYLPQDKEGFAVF